MQFANPNILWVLFAIAIPIIIHIFQFRKHKKIYFTNVDLLKELNIERRNISRLRRLIIMSLRILAIATIVFVFARPYIPNDNSIDTASSNLVNIYIDNSPSMESKNGNITLLDDAKNRAKQVVYLYGDNGIFRIISNSSPLNTPMLNKSDAIAAINDINISFKPKTSLSVVSSFNANLNNASNFSVSNFYISDIQKNNFDTTNINNVDNHTFIVPVTNLSNENINLVSANFSTPVNIASDLHKINIEITNESPIDYEKIPINLYIANKLLSSTSIDLKSNVSTNIPLYFPDNETGVKQGHIEIEDYSINFDNNFYFTYKISNKIKILDIYNDKPNKYVSTLFGSDSLFTLTQINHNAVKYNELSNYDLIILDNIYMISSGIANETINAVKNGSNCLVITAKNIDLPSYNYLLNNINFGNISNLSDNTNKNVIIDFQSPFFSDVFASIPDLKKDNIDLPIIFKYYPIELNKGMSLIRHTSDNSVILSYLPIEKGNIFLLTTMLDSELSDLHLNPLFVPIMYKTSFWQQYFNSYNYLPSQKIIPLNISGINESDIEIRHNTDSLFTNYSIENRNNTYNIHINGNIELPAGNYSIISNGKIIDGFSVNNDRSESVLDFYNIEELNQLNSKKIIIIESGDKEFEKQLTATVTNKELWRLFLILAISFLIIEMILLRIWSNKM